MTSHATLVLILATFLFTGIVRAEDTPILTGSTIKLEDAVGKADVIFVGEITELGEPNPTSPGMASYGAKIKVVEVYKGTIDTKISVGIDTFAQNNELAPLSAHTYIFFVHKPNVQGADAYEVLKLLPDTKDYITKTMLAILKAKAQAKLIEIEANKK